jgi:AcrR family transcriptional regulator
VTTVDEIAAAAGVTQRTFFRHFADKEEVLFDADAAMHAVLREGLLTALGDRPADGTEALRAARAAVRALASTFEADREQHRLRAAVLAQATALQARQMLKESRWTESLVGDLLSRGADATTARAAVSLAGLGLRLAHGAWLAPGAPPGVPLGTLLDRTERVLDDLRAPRPAALSPSPRAP